MHGLMATGEITPHVPDRYRLIVPGLPRHGRSRGLRTHSDRLAEILEGWWDAC